MTGKRTDGDTPKAKQAKGSVKEAIGKLLGDDAITQSGAAEKKAAAADTVDPKTSSRR